eukprot:2722775-Karenia_brevis.AAC.1
MTCPNDLRCTASAGAPVSSGIGPRSTTGKKARGSRKRRRPNKERQGYAYSGQGHQDSCWARPARAAFSSS